MPKRKVMPNANDLIVIKHQRKLINNARVIFTREPYFMVGFVRPVVGRVSGVFGSQRILKKMHRIYTIEQYLEKDFGKRCLKNCDITDMTFACIGGVDALQNSVDWVSSNRDKKAIVVCSDLSKYSLNSTGEYTQGAGAVALLISENPSILSIENQWGVATKSENDFFKPRRQYKKANILIEAAKILNKEVSQEEAETLLENTQSKFWSDTNDIIEVYKEEPIFEGQFSNESYKARVYEAIEDFNNQNERNILKEWENIVFHLPYAYHGRRMITHKWIEWMEKNGDSENIYSEVGNPKSEIDKEWIKKVSKSSVYKNFVEQKIAPGEKASSEIGNMYTASIFMSLISSLVEALSNGNEFANKKIGFISYGSGSKAKIFEGTVQNNWKDRIGRINLFQNLDSRKKISINIYEQLHKRRVSSNINNNQGIIKLKNIDKGEFTEGLRNYFKY